MYATMNYMLQGNLLASVLWKLQYTTYLWGSRTNAIASWIIEYLPLFLYFMLVSVEFLIVFLDSASLSKKDLHTEFGSSPHVWVSGNPVTLGRGWGGANGGKSTLAWLWILSLISSILCHMLMLSLRHLRVDEACLNYFHILRPAAFWNKKVKWRKVN